MLYIQKFIKENENWEILLSSEPYCLKIKRHDTLPLILFMYNHYKSDLSEEICQESRGLILEDHTFKVVCYPFKKFFNYGESLAATIDWDSVRLLNKLDGSIIKMFYYENKWRTATNSTIDASQAPATLKEGTCSFKELFDVAAARQLDETKLNKNYTYMFELVSDLALNVVRYKKTEIWHIGSRNNITLLEEEVDIGVQKPETLLNFPNDLFAAVEYVNCYNAEEKEGLVAVDKFYNRVKIKGEDYVRAHYLRNNGAMNIKRALEILRDGEKAEYLCYFPEHRNFIEKIECDKKDVYDTLLDINYFIPGYKSVLNRKEFAENFVSKALDWVKPFCFSAWDGKLKDKLDGMSVQEWKKLIIEWRKTDDE